MPVSNRAEARDEILALFTAAWKAGPTSTPFPILYDDKKGPEKPSGKGQAWCRVMVRHTIRNQGSLSGADGKRRWTNMGIVTVQIFTPKGDGLSLADELANIGTEAFEGQTTGGGIWFRNVRANEAGTDGHWDQTNVVAEFEYDEVK